MFCVKSLDNKHKNVIFASIHCPLVTGAYVPLTTDGNIVVDGILASCYPAKDHDLSQFAMTPIMWFPQVVELIFGEGKGTQTFVNIINDVAIWVLPLNLQNESN